MYVCVTEAKVYGFIYNDDDDIMIQDDRAA
jgi:hypothetical protein